MTSRRDTHTHLLSPTTSECAVAGELTTDTIHILHRLLRIQAGMREAEELLDWELGFTIQ